MGEYTPPVDQLLEIGNDLDDDPDWYDYPSLGLGPEHIADLIRMAVDLRWNEDDPDDPANWGRIHAWRALGTLRAEAAVPTLVGIQAVQDLTTFDDWVTEELPPILGMIGPPAIPELTALLFREGASEYARTDAARSLAEVAKRYPEVRSECVALLVRALDEGEGKDPASNGSIVSSLIDLEAKEAAGAIERAYAADLVDDSICGTWHDVWHELHLEGEPPPQTERRYKLGPFFDFGPPVEPPPRFEERRTRPPAERPSPEHRKERNKARQKLEKKAKGKKGRRR